MTIYMGLDVHSKQTSFCVQDEFGEVIDEGAIETSESALEHLLAEVNAPAGTRIGLETGIQARWVARVLAKAGMQPVVIDAYEVRQKARRRGQKSDRRDAFEICDGLRRGQWSRLVWMPSAQIETLRQILSRRRHFVKVATGEINSAKFLLRSHGFATTGVHLSSDTGWRKLLQRPEMSLLRAWLELHWTAWALAQNTVTQLERQLEKALQPFKYEMELLSSVPAVGLITAATFLAAIGSPQRFATSGQVASYIGLVPSTYDSGERERHGSITHQGSKALRTVLCECAHQARHISHPLNPYWRRLSAKSGPKRAAVAIANRLARILWRLWRSNRPFDVHRLNVVFKPSTHAKTYLFHLKKETVRSLTA